MIRTALGHTSTIQSFLARSTAQFRRSFFSLPELQHILPGGGSPGNQQPQTFHERKILPYTQRQLYTLVSDVDSYRYFLPFCKSSRVLTPLPKDKDECGPYTVEAELTVGFKAIEESYVSKVTCTPFERVQAVGKSSLFNDLSTTWSFQPASPNSPHPTSSGTPPPPRIDQSSIDVGPTLVNFDISYAFANPLHAAIASRTFGAVSMQIMEAFERRCLEVYGRGSQ